MAEFLLYGIDEAGQAAYCELLRDREHAALPAVAEERLRDWGSVEIWEGPVCVLRVRRPGVD